MFRPLPDTETSPPPTHTTAPHYPPPSPTDDGTTQSLSTTSPATPSESSHWRSECTCEKTSQYLVHNTPVGEAYGESLNTYETRGVDWIGVATVYRQWIVSGRNGGTSRWFGWWRG